MARSPIQTDPIAMAPEEVARQLEAGEIVLVDVRETREYDLEHIAGALLMPLSELEPDAFKAFGDTPVVLHCAIGKRSAAAGRMLLKAGRAAVGHMEGGLNGWKAAGLVVEEPLAPQAEAVGGVAPLFLCPTPGHVLREEFLAPSGLAVAQVAGEIGVAASMLERLIAGTIAVDAELSLRLARYFSTAADFWLHVQIEHDLERTRHALGGAIHDKVRPRAA